MDHMFYNCSLLENLDLTSFNTSIVEKMNSMFMDSSYLRTIYVSKDKWIIGDSCTTTDMFTNCGTGRVTYK